MKKKKDIFAEANAEISRLAKENALMRNALEFYANPENFAYTVWRDEGRDGPCWLEPIDEISLTEVYGEDMTAEFGIAAQDCLDSLD